MDLALDRPTDVAAQVRVCRPNVPDVTARLRLLGYDSCEFECDCDFTVGERVSIHIHRMGSIRARITGQNAQVVEAEFDQHCPV